MAFEAIKNHPIITSGVAVGALAVGGFGAHALANREAPKPVPVEFTVPDSELAPYCDVPAWNDGQYQVEIGNAASVPVRSINDKDKEVKEINKDVANSLKPNNFAIAYMKTLMDYQSQPVNFADINTNAWNEFSRMNASADVRRDDCKKVMGKILVSGDHVTVNSSAYVEAVPKYDAGNKLVSGNLDDAQPNATSVSGFWVKAEPGALPVALTPEGRLLISKTIGNEDSTTTVTTIVPGEGQNPMDTNNGSTGISEGPNPEANPGPLKEAKPGNDNTPNGGPTKPGGPTPTQPGGPTPTSPNQPPVTLPPTTPQTPTTKPPVTTSPPPPTTPPPTTPATTLPPKTPPSSQPTPPPGY